MNNLISALENSDEQNALRILNENPQLLTEKSEDGWAVIQLASYYNNPNVINYCLTNGTKEIINSQKVHPLLIALEEKNKEAVNAFLEFSDSSKIDWNVKEKNGDNLVALAVYYDMFEAAEKLVKKGISCFDKNNQDLSAFALAVDKGNISLLHKLDEKNEISNHYDEILIKKSIQKDSVHIFEKLHPYTDLSADELFSIASGFGSVKIVNQIMQSGDIIPGMDQVTKIVGLMCKKYDKEQDILAAKELADYLFEIKIPFSNFVNEQGQSAWMLCIQNDNEEVFERLMRSSENVNITDSEEHSPLFYAIEKNNPRFVKMLLKKKANPNHVDKQNNTPLMKAVEKGNVEMVKDILNYCQMVNHTNINNEHALSIAIKRRRMDIVTELIWAGGEITTNPVKNVQEKHIFFFGENGTPGTQSYFDEENIDNFVALSKLGFRLDQKNSEGDTFLLHFIKNGYMANFSAILRCQFNPNQIDNDGNTALMCAAMKRQDEYFNAMTRKFGNLEFEHKNTSGDNVYDICLKTNKVHRVEQLLTIDQNISLDNAQKAVKLIAKEGNLSNFAATFKKVGLDLTFEDEYKNNLLMYSLAGGNLENFKYLVEECGMTIDLTHKNKNGNTIQQMIEALPTEIGDNFKLYINKSPKKKP